MNKKITILVLVGILSFFGFRSTKSEPKVGTLSYEQQIEIFKTLGYEFADGVTKELILTEGYAEPMWNQIRRERLKRIEEKPFSHLYFYYGWGNPKVPGFYFSDECIWYDLEFIDSPDKYIWLMKRMGVITKGEIRYTDISIEVDDENYEWIKFKVNGIDKKWKLQKVGYISGSLFKRFSYLPSELNTKGKYTYYDEGGQQFVIDYATESEQKEFIEKTGLQREWLDEGNHFIEPK